jgi:hypothetical protein
MKRILALSALLVFSLALAEKATVAAIAKDPAKFDNKVVTVPGKVAHFEARTSKAGNKYFTFTLEEGKAHIAVYGHGELNPMPKNGDKVEATGIFAKERKSAGRTYSNELDVSSKGKDKNGVTIKK